MDSETRYHVISIEKIIIIIGSFVTIIGSINAFFLKGIYNELNQVKINMVQIATESNAKEYRIQRLESEALKFREELRHIERRIKQ